MNFNYDQKWYSRIAKENEKRFGCTVPFHPPIYSELTNNKIKICDNLTLGQKAQGHYLDSRDNQVSANDTPCAKFDIDLGLPDIDYDDNEENEAFIRLYIKTEIRVKSITIYYDLTSFGAEIGGYVGMFLGVSLIDLAIMFNSGVLKCVHKIWD